MMKRILIAFAIVLLAANAQATRYWNFGGRLLVEPNSWNGEAKGATELTLDQYNQALCVAGGGTWSNSACVYPPPVPPPPYQQFTQPIVAPAVVVSPALDGHGYELGIDTVNGVVVPVERLSAWQDDATVSNRLAAAIAARTKRLAGAQADLGSAEPLNILRAEALVNNARINALANLIETLHKTAAVSNACEAVKMTPAELKSNIVTRLPPP